MSPNPTVRLLALALLGIFLMASSGAAADPAVIDVWPGAVPGEPKTAEPETAVVGKDKPPITRVGNVSHPTLAIYRPAAEANNGAAVIICPGGGYSILAWDLEGTEVAQWLNSIGVTGIVLKYRVPVRKGVPRHLPPLQDAQRALSLVRSRAGEWGIDPKKIGILGFSAGGNLSAYAETHYDSRAYDPVDDIDRVSCRPDFAVLVYPAWLVQEGTDNLDPDLKPAPQTPPTFLTCAGDDPLKPDSSVVMYLALKHAGVPAELHVYATGGHGYGLRPTTQPCATWPQRCEAWLSSQGFLGARKQK